MRPRAEIAIIAGTGMENLFPIGRTVTVETSYGTSPMIRLFPIGSRRVAFLSRHGPGHSIPPHRINYRGNIEALHLLGVKRILATNAVGTLTKTLKPGAFVCPHDFIDLTRGRPGTFYEGPFVAHVDVTEPYCNELAGAVTKASRESGSSVHCGAVYACTEGPRYETVTEIKMIRKMGGTLVGQTGVPEVILARERAICYSSICVVTNYAAGLQKRLSTSEVLGIAASASRLLARLLQTVILYIPKSRKCVCASALNDASFPE